MGVEYTEEWVREYCTRTGQPIPEGLLASGGGVPIGKKRPKYGNQKTERAGRTFDSKHEADVYDELMLRVRAGELLGVFVQHPFRLPGDVVYVSDFVTLNLDGTYTVIDAKSEATRKDKSYRIKRRLMRNCLGIAISEV